jgi:hypothetical protein
MENADHRFDGARVAALLRSIDCGFQAESIPNEVASG